jgi:hypothetical protein
MKEIRQSIKPDVYWRTRNRATIQNISINSILAASEICMLHEVVRSLRSQIAQSLLSAEINKNCTHLPDSAVGDEIRWVIGIMDGPIVTAL